MTLTAEFPTTASEGRWRWTRKEFHQAADMGLFGDTRVELLDGEVLVMAGQKTPHFTALRFTTEVMAAVFGEGCEVRSQGPVVLSDESEPEPDVVVVPGTARDYADHHPTPPEIRLLVEISDATLATDRGAKLLSYAREAIADYWIVNLVNRQLEVHRNPALLPDGPGYKLRQVLSEGDSIAPLFAPGQEVAVADLLPPVQVQG